MSSFHIFHSLSGFNEVYDALYNVRVFLLDTWLPTNFSLCFFNPLLEDIMSFCTTWIITPGIMVLCGKSKFSSVQLLSAIWNQNCWPVQNKCQKGRLLWHKNTHCRIGLWWTHIVEACDELPFDWRCLQSGALKLLSRKFATESCHTSYRSHWIRGFSTPQNLGKIYNVYTHTRKYFKKLVRDSGTVVNQS